MKQRSAYLLISTTLFASVVLVACSAGYPTTGGSTDLPPQVQEARMLIRDKYPEASYYRIKMNFTRDDETVNAWTNDSDWIYLSSKWIVKANNDIVHAACIIVHEWYHRQGYNEVDAENEETKCKQLIRG